ncbi:GNAT family N-acetyltransferase [Alkalihalobacillus sp. 1P02AB]|uniref:GNAT family N-acetyltransferase n=1 Tax=Alkalihalobacillus sp. 1P02AB TaxID=3132260 RepID=UPI0039A65D4A
MEIQKEANRHFINNENGEMIGEVTYRATDEGKVILDHTFVDESRRGENIASELVASVVTEMKKQNKKIVPLCPFAKAEFKKKKEYQEIEASE